MPEAECRRRGGQRVCLIDLDPQAHATLHFGIEPQLDMPSVYDVMIGDAGLADVRRQVDEHLWVVPSHLDLAAAEVELAGVVGRDLSVEEGGELYTRSGHPLIFQAALFQDYIDHLLLV